VLVGKITVLGRGCGMLLGLVVLAEGVVLGRLVVVVRGGVVIRGGLVVFGACRMLHRLCHDWCFLQLCAVTPAGCARNSFN
jgi:hypothetical protein